MNRIFILILFIGVLNYYSCIDDPGNYNYVSEDEVFPVKIASLEDSYSIMQAYTLKITPAFEVIDDENKYQYLWYVIPTEMAGELQPRDTLARTKDIEELIRLKAGDYTLYFQVKDPVLDVYASMSAKLKVVQTNILGGWYILKDINNETDFDYIDFDGEMISDVLRNVSIDQQLRGRAKKIVYQSKSYYHQPVKEDGTLGTTLVNQQAYHIISNEDMKTFNAANLELFKNARDEFYLAPEVISPGNVDTQFSFSQGDLFLINAGKIYGISSMMPNVGKFAMEKTINDAMDYYLHDDMIATYSVSVGFDKTRRTFYYATANGASLTAFSKGPEGMPSLTEMKANLRRFMIRHLEAMTFSSYAVMENLESSDKGDYTLLSINFKGNATYPVIAADTIPHRYKMPTANVMAAPQDASCVYFSSDNVLNVYRNSDVPSRESLLYTFPTDETVSFIENFKAKAPGDESSVNYLVVTTNTGSKWKMYFFEIIGATPDINATPKHMFEGEGNVRHVIYRES